MLTHLVLVEEGCHGIHHLRVQAVNVLLRRLVALHHLRTQGHTRAQYWTSEDGRDQDTIGTSMGLAMTP